MCFLWSGVFWGVVLVLIGISVIINVVFHVHIPVFRIIIALILIYMGIKVLLGNTWCRGEKNVVAFREEVVAGAEDTNEYSVVFGKSAIDLTTLPADTKKRKYRVNVAFGSSVVTIPADIPVIIRASSAFGGVNFPNGSTISFGEYVYKNKAYTEQADAITVKIDVAFGGCSVLEK